MKRQRIHPQSKKYLHIRSTAVRTTKYLTHEIHIADGTYSPILKTDVIYLETQLYI